MITAENSNHHIIGEPPILYFGTPIVLVSSMNNDDSFNLAPISSVFWLGWRGILGVAASSKTTENLKRTRECVLNLPSAQQVDVVDRLALTTGTNPVPPNKAARGYCYTRDKFETAGLTPVLSETVAAPRALECPIHLEASVKHIRDIAEDNEAVKGRIVIFEVLIQRVHLSRDILMDGNPNRIDPDRWRPLIMSFAKFYGLSEQQLHPSRLANIPEELYRSPDVDVVRAILTKNGPDHSEPF